MKRTYQIDKQRAAQEFRTAASQSDGSIQLTLPMKQAAGLIQQGLMQLAMSAFRQAAEQMMRWDVDRMVGPKNAANSMRELLRWGSQPGFCVLAGQKVPVQRPRVRGVRGREVPLGSYEALQQASLMDDAVWNKLVHGLTTRRYSAIVRELKESYGIEKTAISDHFIQASRYRLQKLESRPLNGHRFCTVFLDGTVFNRQNIVVALGLTTWGEKMVLGLRQGATEHATVVKQLLEDLRDRGLDFEVPRLYVLDGGKALQAAVRKMAGDCAVIQRCQVHKIRNVVDHLSEEHKSLIRVKLCNAYSMWEHADAKCALEATLHRLMHLNPSAAKSLEEGMADTICVQRLRTPRKLRSSLASTNIIESAFSVVETVCRNVKRWHGGDQYLRWIATGLLWAESRWNRIRGYREIPILVKELELAVTRRIPVRHPSAG